MGDVDAICQKRQQVEEARHLRDMENMSWADARLNVGRTTMWRALKGSDEP